MAVATPRPLSAVEAGRLRDCEAVVHRGVRQFIRTGQALAEIRDGRLYRCTHNTFEAYCNERWGMVRQTAGRLIAASVAADNVGNGANGTKPQSESVLRPLVNLPVEEQRKAWALAVETAPAGKVTARVVQEAVTAVNGGASDNNQWFTPPEYIERAQRVLGGIDLDPASCDEAQKTVQARRYFTTEDDGLAQPWTGRVWLNPPYSGLITQFVYKLLDSHTSGDVSAAVLLTHSVTDQAWFHAVAQAATALCFTRGRIRFSAPGGEQPGTGQRGHVFYYLGPDLERFKAEFSGVGSVVVPG